MTREYYKPTAEVVAITQAVGKTAELLPKNDAKALIAFFARISNPSNKYNSMTAPKLVKYLQREGHWSPLDMVDIAVEITTARDIARQMLRHYSMRFQEFSQRYAVVSEPLVFRECRMQDEVNRQNSLECTDQELILWWEQKQEEIATLVEATYKEAIERKIAKEEARVILPEGMTVSSLFIKGSVRSWIHYLGARQHKSTQKEHRELANAIAESLKPYYNVCE